MNYRQTARKSPQTEDTLNWIQRNYEFSEGVCLPRCLLYEHYLDYCQSNGHSPIGAAAFGKLIRKKFKEISTRRLGTRGKSKYHYYGLGIQKSSKYYIDSYCTRNIARFKGIPSKMKRTVRVKKSRCLSSAETSLQRAKQFMKKFPKTVDIVVPLNMSQKKLDTFILMYKTHCNQLLDTILCSHIDDFANFVSNFWSGIPSHLKCLFNYEFTAKLIECCDFIYYEALLAGLTPCLKIESFDGVLSKLEQIAERFVPCINEAIKNLPKNLIDVKIKVLNQFINVVTRNISFLPLLKDCYAITCDDNKLNALRSDMDKVDVFNVFDDLFAIEHLKLRNVDESLKSYLLNIKSFTKFEDLMLRLKDIFVAYLKKEYSTCIISKSSEFILVINQLFSLISRELTLSNAIALDSWSLILTTLQEYILFVAECITRRDSFEVKKLMITKYCDQFESTHIDWIHTAVAFQ